MKIIGFVSLVVFLVGLVVVGCAPVSKNRFQNTVVYESSSESGLNLEVSSMLSSAPVLGRASHERAIVALEMYNQQGVYVTTCTGILIRSDVVLTAGHCFDATIVGQVARIDVVNSNDLETAIHDSSHRRRLVWKVPHPQYNSRAQVINGTVYPSYDHDLALGFLDSGFDGSVTPARLPAADVVIKPGASVVSYGYGKAIDLTDSPRLAAKSLFRNLQRGSLTVSEKTVDDRVFTRESSKSSLCYGDSGGPTFSDVRGSAPALVALNSASNGKLLVAGGTVRKCRGESVLQPIGPSRTWIEATLRQAGK